MTSNDGVRHRVMDTRRSVHGDLLTRLFKIHFYHMSQGLQTKEMPTPGPKINVQTWSHNLVTAPVVGFIRQDIAEKPRPSSQFIPGDPDERLGGPGRKIHDDHVTFLALDPAPGENILAAPVVGPAAFLAEAPFAISKDVMMDLLQTGVRRRPRGPDRPAHPGGGRERRATSPSVPRTAPRAAAWPRGE